MGNSLSPYRYTFEAKCIKSYSEENKSFWTEGKTYLVGTNDFKNFTIRTDEDVNACLGENWYSSFSEYFESNARFTIPLEWLSDETIEECFRERRAQYVKEDIERTAEDNNIIITPEKCIEAARAYANGKYDCNLDYWANIDNLLNEYGTPNDDDTEGEDAV
jgi:hypothetical protein